MYNSQDKCRFIDLACNQESLRSEQMRQMFDVLGEYETRITKDICFLTNQEVHTLFNDVLVHLSVGTRSNYLSLCRRYVEWCKKNGVVQNNPFDWFRLSDLYSPLDSGYIASPARLKSIFDKYFRPVEALSYDNIFRIVFWLLFIGVPKDELLCVYRSDVDLEQLTVLYNNEKLRIPKEAQNDIKVWLTQDVIYKTRRNGSKSPYDLIKTDKLLWLDADKKSSTWIETWIAAKIKEPIDKLSPKKVFDSGCCYRVQWDEMALANDLARWGGDCDVKNRDYQYIWRKKAEARRVYESWQKSYGIIVNVEAQSDKPDNVDNAVKVIRNSLQNSTLSNKEVCLKLLDSLNTLMHGE